MPFFQFLTKFPGILIATTNVTWCYSQQTPHRWTLRVAAELFSWLLEINKQTKIWWLLTSHSHYTYYSFNKQIYVCIVQKANTGWPSCKDLARSEWCAWCGSAPDSHRVLCSLYAAHCGHSLSLILWGRGDAKPLRSRPDTLATTALVVRVCFCTTYGLQPLIDCDSTVSLLRWLCWAIQIGSVMLLTCCVWFHFDI